MIDFHCHLDLYPEPVDVAARAKDEGHYILSVTTTPKAWRGTSKLTTGAPRIRTALGLHPQVAHERYGELALFEGLLPEARYVGEVGLDGSPESRSHHDIQMHCFERILAACASSGGRGLTVHSRGAVDEVLDTLSRYPEAGTPVLHWFAGTKRQLERAVAIGCWFSVGPAMVRGRKGCELLALMPPERVLTETDGPFARAGRGPLMPGQVADAVTACRQAWATDVAHAQTILSRNLRNLAASIEPAMTRSSLEFGRPP